MKTWAYGLTADEWFHLACEGENSEVPPCCGNIGAIRDELRTLMTFQAPDDFYWRRAIGRQLLELLEADSQHDLDRENFPLLHRVLDGIQAEQLLGSFPCASCLTGKHDACSFGACTCEDGHLKEAHDHTA